MSEEDQNAFKEKFRNSKKRDRGEKTGKRPEGKTSSPFTGQPVDPRAKPAAETEETTSTTQADGAEVKEAATKKPKEDKGTDFEVKTFAEIMAEKHAKAAAAIVAEQAAAVAATPALESTAIVQEELAPETTEEAVEAA